MLSAVRDVSCRLIKEIGKDTYYNLENIVFAIEAYTVIDEIVYIGYDVPATNPIWGQFWRYTNPPQVYKSAKTIVEVRYALHLNTLWRRFVVCKELCHALDADEGAHSATTRSIDRIMSRFALMSAHKPIATSFPAFDAETLAEIGALELLCPLELRKEKIGKTSVEKCCLDYGIPQEYGKLAFSPEYIEMVEALDW